MNIKNLDKKDIWKAILLLVVIAIAIVFVYKQIRPFDPSADPSTFTTSGQLQSFYKNLEDVYKKDTYGGKTPEETLQLFIDALKNGDTDLAAKYYIPELQKKVAENLGGGMKSGGVDLLISVLEKEKIGSNFSEGRYRFVTRDENNNAEFQFDLVFNPQTKVWKIESL